MKKNWILNNFIKHFFLCLFFLGFFLIGININAQEKYESETRIKRSEVPIEAVKIVNEFANNKKARWYLEEGLNSKSIEAKFKLNSRKFSVEFDTLGKLQDIEIELKESELQLKGGKRINDYLAKECTKYKIQKVQAQFLSNSIQKLNESYTNPDNYELVVKCKKNKSHNLFEYLFSVNGNFISKSKIIFKNSINLEY